MKTLVYLDQNIISELRDRKLFETKNEQLMMLKSILMRSDIDVVYSHVTIDEIGQIVGHENDEEYFREHYWVLEQLEAKYIEPSSKKLIDEKPHIAALNYLKNVRASYNTPYPYFAKILEDFNRKLSGLPVDKSLDEMGNDIKKSIDIIMNDAIKQINSLNENEHKEPIRGVIVHMKEALPELLKNSLKPSSPFADIANTSLGTKSFREHELTKKIMDPNPSGSELVMEIKRRWEEWNPASDLSFFADNLTESKIFHAYTQLNWLDYHADDFDKVKKNKDRFNASQNDMRHASFAHTATYLISNDKKFREKTIVSYEFADVKTIVCTPDGFLKEYTLNKK